MANPTTLAADRALVEKHIRSRPTNIPTVSPSTTKPTLMQSLRAAFTSGGKKRRTRIIKNSKKRKIKAKKTKKAKKAKIRTKKR